MKGISKKIRTLKHAHSRSRFSVLNKGSKHSNLKSKRIINGVSGGGVLGGKMPILLRVKGKDVLLLKHAIIESPKIVAELRECNPIAVKNPTTYKGDTSAQVTGEKVLKGS